MAGHELDRAFAALADGTRRDIVSRLTLGDATVGELAAPYDVSLQAISKHIRVLEVAGLVSVTADAQRRRVHLEAAALAGLVRWIERHQRAAEARLSRLEAVLAHLDSPTSPNTTPTKGKTS